MSANTKMGKLLMGLYLLLISIPHGNALTSSELEALKGVVQEYQGFYTGQDWKGGTYKTPFTVQFFEEGNSLVGNEYWIDLEGTKRGPVALRLLKADVVKRELIFEWTVNDKKGRYKLVFSPDFGAYEGTWGRGDQFKCVKCSQGALEDGGSMHAKGQKMEIAAALPATDVYGGDNLKKLKATKACEGCDLRSAELGRWKIAEANLFSADLTGANLYWITLRKAFLWKADLSSADLRHADLRGADLREVILAGADLYEADLTDADLTGAKSKGGFYLRESELNEATLCRTTMPQGNKNNSDCYE